MVDGGRYRKIATPFSFKATLDFIGIFVRVPQDSPAGISQQTVHTPLAEREDARMKRILPCKRSVIVAADVPDYPTLGNLANAVRDVPGISGFKIGSLLGLAGLADAVRIVRRYELSTPIIYDHQKWGNDIPEMGNPFAAQLARSGVDAAILFPFAGPATQEAYTKACFDVGLQVITGGIMTHPKFLVSEGGYIADETVERIYRFACQLGVQHFVVPGNKVDWVRRIRAILVEELGVGEGNFVLYAPGFITQKGDISECGQAAGDEWHAIVGSAIYGKPTPEAQYEAALTVTAQIGATSKNV